MTSFIIRFFSDEFGAAAAEYALILAIVGAGIAAAAFGLGEAIKESIDGTAEEIAQCADAC